MSEADRNRLVACRACGNRVARDARRCPACGTREPTTETARAGEPVVDAEPQPVRPEPSVSSAPRPSRAGASGGAPRHAARRRGPGLMAALAVVLALAGAGLTALYVTTPLVAPPMPSQSDPVPSDAGTAPTVGEAPAPSRSRGRSEWLFFFKPGDWLTRMADDGLLGVVVRVEKTHTFADGSSGPAYVVQSMEGEERVLDADELERTARLR